MGPILLCVANFSEGRRSDVIDEVVSASVSPGEVVSASVSPPIAVLDVSSDPDHNRTVLTLAGPREDLIEAAISATRAAAERIDLNLHRGAHPRLGSMDLLPFVPVFDSSMSDAVGAAMAAASAISSRLGIPCFLYGEAARSSSARSLPEIRRSAFTTLFPDFGPRNPHPTAGVTVVGARGVLVAYNVNLATSDVAVARQIATSVRESGGGLPWVRAIGVELKSREMVQVSMNLLRPEQTTVESAFQSVADAARREGVKVAGSEIVGLVPRDALGGHEESLMLASAPRFLEDELARAFPYRPN